MKLHENQGKNSPPFVKGDFDDPTGIWFMKFLSLIRPALQGSGPAYRKLHQDQRDFIVTTMLIFRHSGLDAELRFFFWIQASAGMSAWNDKGSRVSVISGLTRNGPQDVTVKLLEETPWLEVVFSKTVPVVIPV